MMHRGWFANRSGVLAGIAVSLLLFGCAQEEDGESFPIVEIDEEYGEVEDDDGECELVYELPTGRSFALHTEDIIEPEAIADIASSYIGSIPPILMFADGLTDGSADSVELVGGAGEKLDDEYGLMEGDDDVYSMYYGSINPDTCDFQARLDGQSISWELEATSEELILDLSGFSDLTDGVVLMVEDVEFQGTLSSNLDEIFAATLGGRLSDEGVETLLDAVQDRLPMSEEQAMDLLDPDDTGEILVEIEMSGVEAEVDGFVSADAGDELEARPEAGSCCPDGLEVGDSILPYLDWQQQGLDAEQYELFQMALPEFRERENVAMVVTARENDEGTVQYEVYSGGAVEEGHIIFERSAADGGFAPDFEVVSQSGHNPLGNTDPTALSEYEEFLEAGINPNSVSYSHRGYDSGDPRLSFVPPEKMHYPYAMERIAHNFDDPRTGDLMILPASWATGGFSTHGNLGSLQSRAPLMMAGPGLRSADDVDDDVPTGYSIDEVGDGEGEALFVDDAVRHVDVAPTIAAALGVDPTTGVGPDLRLSDEVLLGWQDGRVLEEVFTDEALDAIAAGEPVAERAVIIINDGLTNTEILHQALSDNPDFDVDAYRQWLDGGIAYRHGAISNFPSNTYPGHNTIGSGAWAGHHGVVDNRFWEREQAVGGAPIGALFETEYLFGSAHANLPVETLFEAVTRTWGDLDDGIMTASVNEPTSRGAAFASLEYREPEGFEMPDEADSTTIGDEVYDLPAADAEDYGGIMDNSSVQAFSELFQDHERRGEEGLPIPKFTYVNFASTDTAGHAHGPHGDFERYEVVSRTNERMRGVIEVLEYLEIDDETLVVLTADHGMELQDREVSSSYTGAFRDADVSFRNEGWYYYFKQLAVEVDDIEVDGDRATYSLRVIDRATRDADEPSGVAAVDVMPVDGGMAPMERTDPDGYVEIEVALDADADVLFEFDHDEWNMHRQRIAD